MECQELEIKKGIKLHFIRTDQFKTNLMAIMLTTKLDRENVTKNAIIPAVLRRGSKSNSSQEELSKTLEEMYGASFDCGLDKTGDNQVLKFYMEVVNEEFLPKEAGDLLQKALSQFLEIVFDPYLENHYFKKEYVEQEKENIKQIIEGKIDNKARYAMDRCIEEMYKGQPFGLYKYGYIEDLEKIDEKTLYTYYLDLIQNCKIDIFLSGKVDDNSKNMILQNENILKLKERDPSYQIPDYAIKKIEKENLVEESMEVTQGKLVLGLDLFITPEQRYDAMIYNSILGGSANSKLFQNVREKESLAYTASSSYMRFKNLIFINSGIEIPNFEKALEIIKRQIDDMKQGDFTEEEIENAKKGIIDAIKTIDDEQDTQITYFFGQELAQEQVSLAEYEQKVSQVTREEILKVASQVQVDTIYFLKN